MPMSMGSPNSSARQSVILGSRLTFWMIVSHLLSPSILIPAASAGVLPSKPTRGTPKTVWPSLFQVARLGYNPGRSHIPMGLFLADGFGLRCFRAADIANPLTERPNPRVGIQDRHSTT